MVDDIMGLAVLFDAEGLLEEAKNDDGSLIAKKLLTELKEEFTQFDVSQLRVKYWSECFAPPGFEDKLKIPCDENGD